MMFCGKPYSINKFAQAIHVEVAAIRNVMKDQLLNSRIWDPDTQREMIQGLMGEQVSWLMEDRMEVAQQVEVLRESQGSSYKPFISADSSWIRVIIYLNSYVHLQVVILLICRLISTTLRLTNIPKTTSPWRMPVP